MYYIPWFVNLWILSINFSEIIEMCRFDLLFTSILHNVTISILLYNYIHSCMYQIS